MRKYLLPGLLALALRPAASQAQTIVAENFNGTWTTPTTLATAGATGTWGDDGATGDQQWHRNDYTSGWTPSIYSQVQATDADGVAGTYAAFHSTGAASGSTGSLVSPLLSFAGYPDHKVLSFYLSNSSGTDVVNVYLSTDGGLTYGSALATYAAKTNAFDRAFQRVALDLGTSTSGTVKVKITATSDAGRSDIGLDNFQIVNQPVAPLSGTYTINNTLPSAGTNFASFTEAFALLNLAGVGGPTTFRVANGQTFSEQTPPLTVSGTAAAPILFQEATPSASLADNPTITTAAAQGGALVLLNGADYVTFDGINVLYAGTSLGRRFGYVVSNASATNGATYITIRNAAITLSRDIDRSTGLVQANDALFGGESATSTAGANQHNSYYNLKFSNMQFGVNLSGTSTTYPDYDTQLYNCAVGDPGVTADIGGRLASFAYGISAFAQSKLSLHDNVVRNVVVTGLNSSASGLNVQAGGTGADASNVYNNQVITVGTTSETMQRVTAMSVSTASSGVHTLNVYNNFVSEVLSRYSGRSATRTVYITGLSVSNGSSTPGQTINVSFNSVRIDTTPFPFLAASTCYAVESATGAVVNTRNNIFANVSQGKTTNNPIQPQHYTWVSPAAGAVGSSNSVSDYNDLYIAYPLNFIGGPAGFVGTVSFASTYATLADWQAATGQDANSVSVDPLFVSATDLHLQNASPLRGRGTPLAGIDTDIDNLPRSSTAPDIGADEFESPSQDVGITALVQPGGGGTAGSAQPVEVTIRNFGAAATTLPVPVQVVVTAPGGATQTLSASYASPIAAGGSANLVVGNLLVTGSGSYGFVASTTYANDPVPGNNTLSTSRTLTTTNATAWTGAVSTDWYDAANWSAGVPTATLDAQVPIASSGRYPVVASGAAATKSLTLDAGATLTQSGGTLSLAGDLTNNGTLTATGGTVATTGSARQALGGSSPLALSSLTIGAAGATLGTATSLRQVLTLVGDLATSGQPLTLRSSVSGGVATDALVVNSGGVVVGTATVQRSIDPSLNPGLGYRHLSTPVRPTIVNDLATTTTGGNFLPIVSQAYNSDPAPELVQPFPNVFGYDDNRLGITNTLRGFDKGFFSPISLSEQLVIGRGYAVNIAASQLVAFRGTLNNGDLSLSVGSSRGFYPDGGWQLLGNPYPAPLDYSRVAAADRAGLEGAIYVYTSTSQYQGRYRSYVNGIGNPVLPVGQGFFARVAQGQGAAIMTFRNSQRLTAPNGTTLQRPAADPRPLVQLTLQGAGGALADEATVYFEQGATGGFEPAFDAEKLANPTGLNLATTQAGQQLSIDGQPELGASQRVVPLAVGVPAPGVYTLIASQLLNLSAVPVYLRDAQTGALVDLAAQPSYQFTIANAAALNTTRFALVFSPRQVLATAPAALAEQVGLYPNPARTQATIELPLGLSRQPVAATLLDALGRVVRQQALPAGGATHTLPLLGVAPGVYSLRLATGQGAVVKKLVVE
jgi:hypothetical protein